MYSDRLLKLFKKNSIEIGDKIEVKSRELKLQGELMPKTEAGEENTIVIKLDNGYNLGILYDNNTIIKKISARREAIQFPKSEVKSKPGLPKVTLLYTGGTIGSKIDYKSGAVYMLLEPGELLYEVPELSEIANVEVRQLFSISSDDMSYIEWQQIAKEAANALNSGSHGVVITMGTDTMHYTAAALSFMLEELNAPVVITGAQRSSDRGSSDAFFNLACAVQLAAKSDIAEVGICMHQSSSDDKCVFIRGTRARKMHTSRRDAFRPVNDRPIATIDRKYNIEYKNDYNRIVEEIDEKIKPETRFNEKVALIKSYPNSDPEVIDFYVKKGFKGIIIEGTGLGHFPETTKHSDFLWNGHIANAVKKGVVVGMTSQCLYGRVNGNVYSGGRIILSLGVVYCEDMLPETALVKLGWLLGRYGGEKAKELLNKNLVGEIKKRSRHDEFLK